MPGYIPARDNELEAWAVNFSTRITAAPAAYGLTAPIAAAVDALVDAFVTALAAAVNPATRTPVTVAAKDSARGAMVPVLRLYGQQVKANTAVTDAQKTDLGLHIDDPVPTPIPPPATIPVLTITGSGTLTQSLRFADSATPTRRTKPPGSIGMQLYRTVAVAVATDPEAAKFTQFTGKALFEETFAPEDVGKVATYWGKWQNAKGEEGPWSAAVSRVIT